MINCLLFADDLVLLAFSDQDLQLNLIGFLLHATKRVGRSALKGLRYCLSRHPRHAVHIASKRQYIAACEEVPYALVWYLRVTEDGIGRLINGFAKQTQFGVSFIGLWS